MNQAAEEVRARLFALQDKEYQAFNAKLLPTIPPERIIGVRMPLLRKLAAEYRGTGTAAAFLAELPHTYCEENNLHGLLICTLRDYDETVAALERFLPHVDNWATCDLLSPKAFAKHPDALPGQIRLWLDSGRTYTVRFALGMLMQFYLDEQFTPQWLDWAAGVQSEEYYVNMMIAWYFATALAKQPQATLPVLEQNRLSPWVHNKTIQKAIESDRITPGQKAYLRTLRRKAGPRGE